MSQPSPPRLWPPLAAGAVGLALLAMLPWAAGRDVQGGVARLIGEAEQRAASALSEQGHGWASVDIDADGIARLVGAPPNPQAQAAALQAAQAALADRTGLPGVIARWETHAAAAPVAPARAPIQPSLEPKIAQAVQDAAPKDAAPQNAAVQDSQDCTRDFAAQLRATPVRFASNAAAPTRASAAGIAALAQIARRCAAFRITVIGHSDTRGAAALNQRLSEQRARAILRALADAGVDPAGLRALGVGETRPLDRRRSPGADARNRRIDITATPRA